MECVFCGIVTGEVPSSQVFADERVVAFLDVAPATRGHLLVVPRRHAASLAELDPVDAERLIRVAQRLAAATRDALGVEGVNLMLSDGAAAGQEVPHVHLHVVPRAEGDGFRVTAEFQRPSREELDDVAARIREHLPHGRRERDQAPAPVRIRTYQHDDRQVILGMAHRLQTGVAPWRDPVKVHSAVRGWVSSSLEERGDAASEVLVAESNSEVVGFVTVTEQEHWSGERDAYIGELVVREGCDGRGIGRALVAAVESWATGRGLSRIRLATGAANTGALRLYESAGYLREDVVLSRAVPEDEDV